jgi:MFS-type transporter involved in bile tolerance (Atg22 family)
MSFSRVVVGAVSSLVAGILHEKAGVDTVLYYIAAICALAASLLLTTHLGPAEISEDISTRC